MPKKVLLVHSPTCPGPGFFALFHSLAVAMNRQWPEIVGVASSDVLLALTRFGWKFESADLSASVCRALQLKSWDEILDENSADLKIVLGHSAPCAVNAVTFFVLPTVQSVNQAYDHRLRMLAGGMTADKMAVVLFDDGLPSGLDRSAIEQKLGPLDAVVPFDPLLFLAADHKGMAVQAIKPSSRASKEIFSLADELTQLLRGDTTQGASSQKAVAHELTATVMKKIWSSMAEHSQPLPQLVEKHLNEAAVARGQFLDADQKKELMEILIRRTSGLGPLETWMSDDSVNEIMVNGPKQIFVERMGRLERVDENFANNAQLQVVIDRIVRDGGRRVDTSSPLCDVRLKDGSRVNVVLPPLAVDGPIITIRRFRRSLLSMDDLIKNDSITPADAERLKRCVTDRLNIVIAGNSGSGKTTLLNVLSRFIADGERVVTLEDAAELQLQQPHVIRLETRKVNLEGKGEVRMADLVSNALRMRPDRIIVGECRGAEALPMLQAMNTGHDGCMTTLHANSAADALKRLQGMILLAAPEWPISVVQQQIHAALDVVIFLTRENGRRRLVEILDVREPS